MACNARGSSGRPHTSSQCPAGINDTSMNDGETQFDVNMIEAQSQEDSTMLEKMGQGGIGRHTGLHQEVPGRGGRELEVEESTRHKSASSSCLTAHPRWSRPTVSRTTIRSRPVSPNNKSSIKVPLCMIRQAASNSQLTDLLDTDLDQPPVTVATLKELDLHSIQSNLNLRIDICHDLELFFQPVSGRKAVERRTEARRYWLALVFELRIYFHNCQGECYECQKHYPSKETTFRPRLPILCDNLREIVQMLVPESDHDEVVNHLDTDLLVQQVQVGILDAIGLSKWLTGLLISHCAPCRDSSAVAVTEQIRIGTEMSDMTTFVDGLEKLFGLLEGMKLDIVNYQIRSFRYPLIEGTVEFQRDCFARAIEEGQIDIRKPQQWYKLECLGHRIQCRNHERTNISERFAGFIHGLVRLCNPYSRHVPVTLNYDQQRISRLQEDLQDHIQMTLCLAVFDQRVRELSGGRCDPAATCEELKRRIIDLTEDDERNAGAISDHLDAIGMEITRAAFSLQSNKRRSFPLVDAFDFAHTTELLHKYFKEEDEQQIVTMDHLAFLEGRVTYFVKQFQTLTELEISHAQRTWAQARTGNDILLAEWDDMARKIAHIAVIHWRVWEELCYTSQTDLNNNDEQDSSIVIGSHHEGVSHTTFDFASSTSSGLTPSSSRDTHYMSGISFKTGNGSNATGTYSDEML